MVYCNFKSVKRFCFIQFVYTYLNASIRYAIRSCFNVLRTLNSCVTCASVSGVISNSFATTIESFDVFIPLSMTENRPLRKIYIYKYNILF